jgi:hypothetical protein
MDGNWEFTDSLIAESRQSATSFIHLHPAVLVKKEAGQICCEVGADKVVIETFGCDGVELVKGAKSPVIQGWYFPEFGQAIPATTIILRRKMEKGTEATIFGYCIKPS